MLNKLIVNFKMSGRNTNFDSMKIPRLLKLKKEQSSIKKVECHFTSFFDLLNKKKNDKVT